MYNKLILLIDDNKTLCNALSTMLESQGYQVASVNNGHEALEFLEVNPGTHVIYLDLLMPVLDGWKFLKLKKNIPSISKIPVIITSAKNNFINTLNISPHEFVLHKPFNLKLFNELLVKCLNFAC